MLILKGENSSNTELKNNRIWKLGLKTASFTEQKTPLLTFEHYSV